MKVGDMVRDTRKRMGRERAPIAEAMRAYGEAGTHAFHTPGHKQGLGAHRLLRELVTARGLREEVSLMGELDDLHRPEGCIRAAQDLAAELYGADRAFFMVNGTTGAIHAMLMAALRPGDKVFLPRNAHRSMMGGMVLTGAEPLFLQPEMEEDLGIAMGLSPETVEEAVRAHPDGKALALVSPTYYGVASDLPKIADILHTHGMLLLVDEAHGPHLRFSRDLPVQAMDGGADMAAQSTHKLLGSMTQASMLLVREGRVDMARVAAASSLLQTTSPNQLLLASLDIARLQMAEKGEELVGRAVLLAEELRSSVNRIPGLYAFGRECMGTPGAAGLDVTKVTVSFRGLGLSGPEAERILRREYGIQSELADAYNVLFLLTYADGRQEMEYLRDALRDMAGRYLKKNKFTLICDFPKIPPQRVLPREAFFSSSYGIGFTGSAGRISAEQVMFYPPGIPVLCPGEEITEECVDYVRRMQGLGLKPVGPRDPELHEIQVMG